MFYGQNAKYPETFQIREKQQFGCAVSMGLCHFKSLALVKSLVAENINNIFLIHHVSN
jgi:hypothetical protein